jgi:hypothetical protein
MKKLILTTVCAVAVTGSALAAGNLNWGSAPFGSITAQTNATAYSPLMGGGSAVGGSIGAPANGSLNTYYELLYTTFSGTQATITSLSSLLAWNDTGLGATNNPASGGRLAVIAPNSAATVPWSPGTTDSIVVVGWSADLGATWSSVSNLLAAAATGNNAPLQAQLAGALGFLGVSTTGYTTTFDTSTSPGATVFATSANAQGLPIFSTNTQLYLVPVPEPTTLALAGLGGLSLLLFRRQRK